MVRYIGMLLLLLLCCSTELLCSEAANALILPVKAVPVKDGQQVNFFTTVQIGGTHADFLMDSSLRDVSLEKCNGSKKLTSFTFGSVVRDWFPGGDVVVNNIKVECGGGRKNVAGLGYAESNLPLQVIKLAKLPRTFAYCLGSTSSATGQLSFGRTNYYIYRNSDVLNSTMVPLTKIPLTISDGSYEVMISKVSMGSTSGGGEDKVAISSTVRYTRLVASNYDFLRQQFVQAATKLKLKQAAKLTFGELDLCYDVTTDQMKSLPSITMVFKNGAKWVVPPRNYLARKTGTKNVACFAIVGASRSASVIGTLQQEDSFVEFNLQNRTLGVSGSLVANLGSDCNSVRGT